MTGPSTPGPRASNSAEPDSPVQEAPDRDGPARASTPSRRTLFASSLGALAGAAIGAGATVALGGTRSAQAASHSSGPDSHARPWPVHGNTQAGIERPDTPQGFGIFQVVDLSDRQDTGFLPELGRRIATLVSAPPPDLLPDGPRGLTVTIGLGPAVIRAVDPTLPGADDLPAFHADDQIPDEARGGDMLIACCADDPSVLPPVLDDLLGRVPGARRRWSQFGYRGPGSGTVARNPLGFLDGISVPHTAEDFADNVWLDGPLAGGTICVMRRLRLRVADFTELPTHRREDVIGRRLDGTPLSGGNPDDEVNLDAKNPDGTYRIPIDAHVRMASPLRTGSHHMLRRSYSFDNGAGDIGLLFTSYQRDLRTFAITQRQLDQGDHLMRFVTPTGSATFLILPGYTETSPLGDALLTVG